MVGTTLGDVYRVTREIGRGGMGAVYEGVHLRLNRRVAVKVMARELATSAEALARFRREAEVTSQLGHPHIVQVFDFGEAPTGEPYLIMEFLEGEDLDQRLRRAGPLALPAVVHIIKQIASALGATHAKGIVHRDLKPANIFVLAVEGETDFVKVVDFGISKVKAATTRLTSAAAVMGTPNYMSPEQAAGRVDEIDQATDQWALACIAYELLAGRPPFIGDNVASLLYQVVHEAPSPLTVNAPGVPPGIEDVLHSALAKRPAERFASITAFARAFEGAAAGEARAAGTSAAAATRPADVMAAGATLPASASLAPPSVLSRKAQETTFSAAAGEAATADVPATRRRRWLGPALALAAVGVGAVIIARPHAPPVPVTARPASGGPPTSPAAAVVVPAVPVPAPAAAVAPAAPPVGAPRETTTPQARTRRKSGTASRAGQPSARAAADAPTWPPSPSSAPSASSTPSSTASPSPSPAASPPPVAARPSAYPPPPGSSAYPPPPDPNAPPPKQRRHLMRDLKQKLLGD